jgi:hypothetical protein
VKNSQEFVDWVNLFNGKMNCYTTVYDYEHYAETSKVDNSIVLDRMFLDFDSHHEPLINSFNDMSKVAIKFEKEDLMFKMYFSGKGFHIILYGDRINDIRSIQQYYTELAKDYNTLDRTGIQTNRLKRVPNTVNLSSEGPYFCIPITFEDINNGLDYILSAAKTGNHKSIKYGHIPKSWSAVAPIEVSNVEIVPPKPPGDLPILPCLNNSIMVENPGHYARVYLAQWYRDILAIGERELSQEKQDEIVDIIMKEFSTIAEKENVWLDWHEPTTRRYVRGIVAGGYHAPGCKSVLIPQGYCPGKCWRYCE